MNDQKILSNQHEDWAYLDAAAKAITDFRDWLVKSQLTCSGIPDLSFRQHDGKPHLMAEMTIAIPLHLAQPVSGGTPTNSAPKSPLSSAVETRSKKSRNTAKTSASDNGAAPVEQNAAVS